MTKYTLLTYVENKPGVLNKITGLIRRKMYNIDTLTVSDTGDPKVSGMTLSITTDNPSKVSAMMKQIQKIPEVISIISLNPEKSFWREVALIKCNLKSSKINTLKNNYNIEILFEDTKTHIMILQIAGTSRNIDICISKIGETNIIDVTRTGATAMEIAGISPDYQFRNSTQEQSKNTNF